MKTVEYNRMVLTIYKLEDIQATIDLCHPTIDRDIILDLIAEKEKAVNWLNEEI